MITLRMIAEKCGVSTAAVSKALNHSADISDETARRICQTAREMGYMPNAAARALKTKRTHNLGVLTVLRDKNGWPHEFVGSVFTAFQASAEEMGYDVTLLSSQISGQSLGYLEHCQYRGFDGVAVICADFYAPNVRALRESDIPMVAVDSIGTTHSSVMTDNLDAMDRLVGYVYEMGHRRLAYIYGEETFVTQTRREAFFRACAARGIQVPEECVRAAYYNDFETTAQATQAFLRLPDPPTCIFFPDDFAYIGGLNELKASGLRVPEDISAVGFDGIYLSQAIRPRLTTYRQDAKTIGREAMRLLAEVMDGTHGCVPRQVLVPGELLRGETVLRIEP